MAVGAGEKLGRRGFVRRGLVTSGVLLCGLGKIAWPAALCAQEGGAFAGSTKLGVADFVGEARVPMETPLGAELDGRLYTDLSKITPENTITPSAAFYLRTRASELLDAQMLQEVRVGGLVAKPFALSIEELRKQAKPMGVHLMECAGNARSVHFGLMSAARWSGVPIGDLLEDSRSNAQASQVLVSGFDTYAANSASSVPGASWIFAREDLKAAGAFLATELNDAPLAKDHGAPVRLVVPGWYGCTCIKWVNEIMFTGDSAAATSQMEEYASRIMQNNAPRLAKEYRPAIVEAAAMPIRVEKWAIAGKIKYRVVGILWGGSQPVKELQIRFNPDEDYTSVNEVLPGETNTWRFWTHAWTPRKPDTYLIRLRVRGRGPVTRRLDAGYYMRAVEIREV
jgi:DMSO/TMAO reductase YedYZ molybdopterin-dependent catalytic subunit